MQCATKDISLLVGKEGLPTTQIQVKTPEGYGVLHVQEWFGCTIISFCYYWMLFNYVNEIRKEVN